MIVIWFVVFLNVVMADDNVFPNFVSAVNWVIHEMLPTDIYNESCVASDCPELLNPGLCPSVGDPDVIKRIISVTSNCMRRPMCGIQLDPRPIFIYGYKADDFLPRQLRGTCHMMTEGVCLGVSDIVSDVSVVDEHRVNIDIVIPKKFNKYPVRCRFNLSGQLFNQLVGADNITVQSDASYENDEKISFRIALTLVDNALVDVTRSEPKYEASPSFAGIRFPREIANALKTFTISAHEQLDKSEIATTVAKLVEILFRYVFQITLRNCN